MPTRKPATPPKKSDEEDDREALAEEFPDSDAAIDRRLFDDLDADAMRRMILNENRRIDGRGPDDIREITCEVGVLPRAHGSALFTRGQTQALVAVTLGTKMDEQRLDELEGESTKSYMLHYNFPAVLHRARPSRFAAPAAARSVTALWPSALCQPVIPAETSFPYTVRVVSDVLESNGSSSMASVCGGSLALMDAGVPIKTRGGRYRHGPDQGRRQGRHPDRYPRRRRPFRRHGLQGGRYQRGYHGHSDGYQDHRSGYRDDAPGAGQGARSPGCTFSTDERHDRRSIATSFPSLRRESSPSRSTRSRSAR